VCLLQNFIVGFSAYSQHDMLFVALYQENMQQTSRQHNRNRSYSLPLDENKIDFFEVCILFRLSDKPLEKF